MEDKLLKGTNYNRFKKGSKRKQGNWDPRIFLHPPFKISGSAPELNITQMFKSEATDCWVQFLVHRSTIFVYAVCVLGEWNNDCDMLVYVLWLFRPLRVHWLICLSTFIGIK